jgi:hypothetical protein
VNCTDYEKSGSQIVDFDLPQTTIRCAGFGPAEVAKAQRRAKAGRNPDWNRRCTAVQENQSKEMEKE